MKSTKFTKWMKKYLVVVGSPKRQKVVFRGIVLVAEREMRHEEAERESARAKAPTPALVEEAA